MHRTRISDKELPPVEDYKPGHHETPDEDAVRRALASVIKSEAFQNSPTLIAFLQHIVDVTLDGRAGTIKGYSIAVDVLGREPDFNPDKDAVVRVHASRMRQALDTYYNGDGVTDPVVISVPKGSYVPRFAHRYPPVVVTETTATPPNALASPVALLAPIAVDLPRQTHKAPLQALASLLIVAIAMLIGFWLSKTLGSGDQTLRAPAVNTIAVIPIQPQTSDEDGRSIAEALTVDIVGALKRGTFLSVVLAEPQPDSGWQTIVDLSNTLKARFILTGILLPAGDGSNASKLILSLIEGISGFTVWNEKYAIAEITTQYDYDTLIQTVAFDIQPAYYRAATEAIAQADPDSVSASGLFLLANSTPGTMVSSLEWEQERVAIAQKALIRDGDDGLAHSVLANKLSYLALVNPPSDTPEAREAAALHADRALTFAGQIAGAVLNVALQRMNTERTEDATRYIRRAAELDPGNAIAVFMAEHSRYQCRKTPPGRIRQAIEFHERLNPNHPGRWFTASAIAEMHLNAGDFERAERWAREANERSQALTVAYKLAAVLVQQQDTIAARTIIEQQRGRWPNLDLHHFADRAIPRLCAGAEKQDFLQGIYRALANELAPEGSTWSELPM
jgi:TolB-like protein